MPSFSSAIDRDANRETIQSNSAFRATKTIVYDGTTGKGAVGATTLFTVTGDVLITFFSTCTEDLVGAGATIEVGISGNTAACIAQTTATTIDSGEIWVDATPTTVEALPSTRLISRDADIIETVATAAITDGTLTYYCLWRPLSADGNIVAA